MAAELTERKRSAIVALLIARTAQDAARQAGVGERTLRRWMDDPEFRAAYGDASRKQLGQAVGQLRAVAAEALDTLRAALGDKNTGHRIRAAIARLDTAVKLEVDELARRVELLESGERGRRHP